MYIYILPYFANRSCSLWHLMVAAKWFLGQTYIVVQVSSKYLPTFFLSFLALVDLCVLT